DISANNGSVHLGDDGSNGTLSFPGNELSVDSNGSLSVRIPTSSSSSIDIKATVKDGSVQLESFKLDSPDLSLNTQLYGVIPVGVSGDISLEYTPDLGFTMTADGEFRVAGATPAELADSFYNLVEASPAGQLMAHRGAWIDAVANGETNLT